MDFTTFKVRCSAISKVMSNSRSNPTLTDKQEEKLNTYRDKLDAGGSLTPNQQAEMAELEIKEANKGKVILSDTCTEYLMEAYAWETAKKKPLKEQFEISQMKKGKLAEEDSIKLLSVVEGEIFIKNEEQIENDFLRGEPDIYVGDNIYNASKIVDIKSCYDYPTFLKKINCEAENGWKQQVQGYMDITGAQIGEIAHTLVSMPPVMIEDFKKKLFYQGEYVSELSPEFLEKWQQWEHSMTFDDIPMPQRVFKIPVEPLSHSEQQKIYDRVKICRDWLCIFHEQYIKLNQQEKEQKRTWVNSFLEP
jgi:hypothetical protein